MNKLANCLLALAAFIASLEAISREADPPEPDCPAVAPCSGPQLVALPPDGPDGGTDATPPAAQIAAASGLAAPGLLPPLGWLNDTMTALPRRLPWRPPIQASDDGWLAYAATQGVRPGETPIALRTTD
jgi:hypothetical protein